MVAVASGKGGVGKTSVAVALARALAAQGLRVGLLDADLHGPDVPRMLGIRRDAPARSVTLTAAIGSPNATIEAVEVEGLRVASAGFLLSGTQGLTMAGPFAEMMLARLLRQTRWGELDLLLVDLPPGTGDVQQALQRQVPDLAVLLVVTPAEVAHLDTGRAVGVLRQGGTRLLGAVENMAYVACASCGERTALHPPAPADRTVWALGVDRLGEIPFRPGALPTAEDVEPAAAAVLRRLRDLADPPGAAG
ncbi:MAG TPA: P-loop NTPase [Mycobacteriales bacterium]